jgi:hypothetical protein
MQKDYWVIAKKNFRAMGIVSSIFFAVCALGGFDSSNPWIVQKMLLVGMLFFLVTSILFFIIASLFKRRSPLATKVAYTYLTISVVVTIILNFILSSPFDSILYKLLGLAILAYLFSGVYKASKQIS